MSEHNEFDKSIKNLFNEDPKAPVELNWEAMDIDLPPPPKRDRKYFLLLFLLLLLSSVVYFCFKKKEIVPVQVATTITEKSLTETIDLSTLYDATEQKNQTISPSNDSSTGSLKKDGSSEIQDVELNSHSYHAPRTEEGVVKNVVKKNINQTCSAPQKNKNSTSTSFNKEIRTTSLSTNKTKSSTSSSANKNILPVENRINGTSYQVTDKFDQTTSIASPLLQSNSDLEPSQQSNQQSSLKEVKFLPSIPLGNILSVDRVEEVELNLLPTLANDQNDDENKRFKVSEILVGFGYNNFNLTIDETNVLKDKINNVFGNSFRTGIRFDVDDHWKANLMVSYDRYHSTFEHTRELDPIINAQIGLRTNRKEVTFHNNYTNTIGLQVGLDRRIRLTNQLSLYLGFGVVPTYILSATGKTTDDVLVSSLEEKVGKFSVGAAFNGGILLPITRAINLELNCQFNQFFLNEIFINNGVQTDQQSSFSLRLSHRL